MRLVIGEPRGWPTLGSYGAAAVIVAPGPSSGSPASSGCPHRAAACPGTRIRPWIRVEHGDLTVHRNAGPVSPVNEPAGSAVQRRAESSTEELKPPEVLRLLHAPDKSS